jgi:hypothetical protein
MGHVLNLTAALIGVSLLSTAIGIAVHPLAGALVAPFGVALAIVNTVESMLGEREHDDSDSPVRLGLEGR